MHWFITIECVDMSCEPTFESCNACLVAVPLSLWLFPWLLPLTPSVFSFLLLWLLSCWLLSCTLPRFLLHLSCLPPLTPSLFSFLLPWLLSCWLSSCTLPRFLLPWLIFSLSAPLWSPLQPLFPCARVIQTYRYMFNATHLIVWLSMRPISFSNSTK